MLAEKAVEADRCCLTILAEQRRAPGLKAMLGLAETRRNQPPERNRSERITKAMAKKREK